MFSREDRRQERAKFKIYLSFEGCKGFRCGSPLLAVVVSTCAGLQDSGPEECRLWSSGGVLPAFLYSLLLCSRCVACKYGSISLFKGVFSVVWGCCVGLFVLRALRGLWGFCVREWLGGLKACSVFASVFILLLLLFVLSFSSLVLLSSFRLLSWSCLAFLALWLGF